MASTALPLRAATHAAASTAAHRLEVLSANGDPDARRRPLLLVHGAWHAAWCWDRGFMARLAGHGFEVHALSLRGHGGSGCPGSLRRARIADYAADVERVASGLRRRPALVGHSMGSYVVHKVMERGGAPGAALLAPLSPAGALPVLARLARSSPLAVARCNATLSLRPVVECAERASGLLFSPSMPVDEALAHAARLGDESFMAYLDMLALSPLRPSRVSAPVMVAAAGLDRLVGPGAARSLARALGTEAMEFPGSGHDLMLDPGWEAVADAVAAWAGSLD